ncbi:hypothetical protein P1J78_15020 [Psychromarinibacter sp. C21-152]|uniref:Lipoprotein n=1 Tax=Psychromarinibacter sediminicola TaxID=3033385 RepID=A0AAE3NU20_9RHOB|nr:hypothetical protein [Psychromarinibacter sediminicola]MDF0602052.1 hypothetical protein [Psychromarinibacter sediminicola]
MTVRSAVLSLLAALALAACGGPPPASGPDVTSSSQREVVATSGAEEQTKIAELTAAIAALGPDVDPDEAARVARIAVEYPLFTLAPRYGAVDPPLVHNMKVNMGYKPRGLCKDWADDLEARLREEGLQTLSLHRAIANHDNIRIEHSTVIVSALGATMEEGIVLDPWREGRGVLFWSPVAADEKYDWWPRREVFDYKRARGRL